MSNAYIEWMEEAGISSIEKKTSDAMSQKMSVGLFAAVHPPPPSDFSVKQAWCKMSSLQNLFSLFKHSCGICVHGRAKTDGAVRDSTHLQIRTSFWSFRI